MSLISKKVTALTLMSMFLVTACGDDDDKKSAEPETSQESEVEDSATADDAADDGEDAADDSEEADDDASEAGTIVDVASGSEDFTTLVAAVQAAGLVETLSGPGPFTVFAPTDEAFATALESLDMTAEELLADTETLTGILTYHVVPGKVLSGDVVELDGQDVATVNGATVAISVEGDVVKVNDAEVTTVDLEASNGVIHVIDSVLLPPAN